MKTFRDQLEYEQSEMPCWTATEVEDFERGINAHGRKHKEGHRTSVTPTNLLDMMHGILVSKEPINKGAQHWAYRRVHNIKPAQRVKWVSATVDILAHAALRADPYLTMSRAVRIAGVAAVPSCVAFVKDWLESEC